MTEHKKKTKGNIVEVVKTIKEIVVPNYIKKDTIKYKTVNRQTTKYVPDEVKTTKYIPVEMETIFYTPREEPTIKYAANTVPYDVKVPKEVPYDVPVVNMEKVNKLATETAATLFLANGMLEEATALISAYRLAVDGVNATIKDLKAKLDEVKHYEIKKEPFIVQVPVEEKITVIGKVIVKTPSLVERG